LFDPQKRTGELGADAHSRRLLRAAPLVEARVILLYQQFGCQSIELKTNDLLRNVPKNMQNNAHA
jgi:hypothetical protein